MRRKKGPNETRDWEEALKGSLSDEKIQYLKRGKLKKCDYKTILNFINECAIDNLNGALKLFEEGSEEFLENLYRMELLTDTVRNVYFFKDLGFIRESDRKDLEGRIQAAIADFVGQIDISVNNENADLIYHVSELKRVAGITKTS